jgi:tRNA (guanine-N7-)-methyltransferase
MGKNKLKKFSEMETMEFVLQYPFGVLEREGFPYRGKWHDEFFHNSNPVVLELGCGKGEYTVGLARRYPDKNFIGIDIKGARMWTGACQARDEGLGNVAFLRTDIELLDRFFAPGEVAEIWITFPDPQMKKVRKRLTGTRFLELYRKVLAPGGVVNLKTDSPFLYTYTREMARHNGLQLIADTSDLYGEGHHCATEILGIRTYYEQQWLERGLTIKYISFELPTQPTLSEPEVEIEHDTYRSFSRGELQHPELREAAVKPKQ